MDTGLIKKVVITWWPCGGKTTGMAYNTQKIAQQGMDVLVVPEAATNIINAWIIPWKNISLLDFQDLIIKEQLKQEQFYEDKAKHEIEKWNPKPQVILCDRGLMDGQAYVDPDDFEYVLLKNKLDKDEILRGRRYDWVIHMTSAAVWAEEFYTTENNSARTETAAEAKEKDARTQEAWIWTDKLKIINNTTNFDDKIKRTSQALIGLLWLPIPYEIEDKYAVKNIDRDKLNKQKVSLSHITQAYIDTLWEAWIHRIRKLVQGQFTAYIHTIKWPQKYYEKEKLLTENEYKIYQNLQLPNTHQLHKIRHCFLALDQYFELDVFKYPRNVLKPWDIALLEIEKIHEDQQVTIPDWIEAEEVTNDPFYKNATMAWVQL